jgi:uncharacterized protein (DUF433 family)
MAAILQHDHQEAGRRLAECVEKDPSKLGGVPVFRGIRVPVKSLFDHLKAVIHWGCFWLIFLV